jgi:uncharacterized RDD family membrane protein YckC
MMQMSALPDPYHQPEFYDSVPTKRLLAWIVDTVLIVLLCLLIVPFTAFTGLFFFPMLMLVVGFIYRTLTIAGASATPGMRLMSVEFRGADGHRFDFAQAFLHTLGYSLSMSLPIIQLVSVVLMLTSARKQGLTDMVLGTVCLDRPAQH